MYLPARLPAGQPARALAELEMPRPDDSLGLHVKTRTGDVVRVTAPRDQLMFQAGQCLEILSGGLLKATEHFVRGPARPLEVSRNTFAVFCQPKCAPDMLYVQLYSMTTCALQCC
jgi:isopenicillin N synthase-like dioxygenase